MKMPYFYFIQLKQLKGKLDKKKKDRYGIRTIFSSSNKYDSLQYCEPFSAFVFIHSVNTTN